MYFIVRNFQSQEANSVLIEQKGKQRELRNIIKRNRHLSKKKWCSFRNRKGVDYHIIQYKIILKIIVIYFNVSIDT